MVRAIGNAIRVTTTLLKTRIGNALPVANHYSTGRKSKPTISFLLPKVVKTTLIILCIYTERVINRNTQNPSLSLEVRLERSELETLMLRS
jgi:hypothetical protein